MRDRFLQRPHAHRTCLPCAGSSLHMADLWVQMCWVSCPLAMNGNSCEGQMSTRPPTQCTCHPRTARSPHRTDVLGCVDSVWVSFHMDNTFLPRLHRMYHPPPARSSPRTSMQQTEVYVDLRLMHGCHMGDATRIFHVPHTGCSDVVN